MVPHAVFIGPASGVVNTLFYKIEYYLVPAEAPGLSARSLQGGGVVHGVPIWTKYRV